MVSIEPPKKYIYVVRSGSIENLKTPCLEMYTSSSSYDKEIIGKQRRIADTLFQEITIDIYCEHTDNKTMLFFDSVILNGCISKNEQLHFDDEELIFT